MPGRRRKISKIRMDILQHASLPATNPNAVLKRCDLFLGSSGPDPVPPKRLRGNGYGGTDISRTAGLVVVYTLNID
jgi:hypothetical protein